MQYNELSDDGAKILANILNKNPKMRSLTFPIPIGGEGSAALAQAITNHPELQCLEFFPSQRLFRYKSTYRPDPESIEIPRAFITGIANNKSLHTIAIYGEFPDDLNNDLINILATNKNIHTIIAHYYPNFEVSNFKQFIKVLKVNDTITRFDANPLINDPEMLGDNEIILAGLETNRKLVETAVKCINDRNNIHYKDYKVITRAGLTEMAKCLKNIGYQLEEFTESDTDYQGDLGRKFEENLKSKTFKVIQKFIDDAWKKFSPYFLESLGIAKGPTAKLLSKTFDIPLEIGTHITSFINYEEQVHLLHESNKAWLKNYAAHSVQITGEITAVDEEN